jgi:hypothetical protein
MYIHIQEKEKNFPAKEKKNTNFITLALDLNKNDIKQQI